MANVYFFAPGNINEPQWSVEELTRRYGSVNLYSFESNSFWAGFSSFGESIDYRYDGNGLQQGTSNGYLTGMAGYENGIVKLSMDGFNVSVSRFLDYTPGEPIQQLGIFDGNDYMSGSNGNDVLTGYSGADEIWGFNGDDFIHGNHGRDDIWGGDGNDNLRGGHGPDTINGGNGSDWIWGGIGKNVITAGWNDGRQDQIYVPADRVKNGSFGNPGGANADILKDLGREDLLFIHGVDDSSLSFAETTYEGSSGVGIFSEGVLEAFVQGYGWTASQVDAITNGGFYA